MPFDRSAESILALIGSVIVMPEYDKSWVSFKENFFFCVVFSLRETSFFGFFVGNKLHEHLYT